MTISKEKAIELARRAANERGWRWEEPVRVSRSRRFVFFGRLTYKIWTNATALGGNVRIVLDGEAGTVREAHWLPR